LFFFGTGIALSDGVESSSISLDVEQSPPLQVSAIARAESQPVSKNLVLPLFALAVWFIAGGLLTWLLRDLNRVLLPVRSPIPPWAIGLSFLVSGLIASWVCWRSYRKGPAVSKANSFCPSID
jgi:hypothetical protein